MPVALHYNTIQTGAASAFLEDNESGNESIKLLFFFSFFFTAHLRLHVTHQYAQEKQQQQQKGGKQNRSKHTKSRCCYPKPGYVGVLCSGLSNFNATSAALICRYADDNGDSVHAPIGTEVSV